MEFEAPFTAQIESRNGVARIALSGELDMATVPVLKEHLTHFEQNGVSAIMLDLRDLTFVDSSGLHAFLQARMRAKTNGHQIILVGATPTARRLFDLTHTTEFLLEDENVVNVLDQFTGNTARRTSLAAGGDPGV